MTWNQELNQRRAKAKRLLEQGLTPMRVAVALECSLDTAQADAVALGFVRPVKFDEARRQAQRREG